MPTNVDVTTYTCKEKITWHFEHLIMAHKYQKMLENVKQRNGKLKNAKQRNWIQRNGKQKNGKQKHGKHKNGKQKWELDTV